jgi:hypothetical protein
MYPWKYHSEIPLYNSYRLIKREKYIIGTGFYEYFYFSSFFKIRKRNVGSLLASTTLAEDASFNKFGYRVLSPSYCPNGQGGHKSRGNWDLVHDN